MLDYLLSKNIKVYLIKVKKMNFWYLIKFNKLIDNRTLYC